MAQPYTFTTPVTATQIRFINLSNFGTLAAANNKIGFSEVQFDGTVPPPPPTQIPEPSSLLALLAVGLGGVSLRKRI
ncbi:MAG: PEP-CTERM sorting domain-containing protein [Microcystis panniformis]